MRKYLGLVAGFGIVVGTAILVTLPTTAPTTVEAKENMTFSLAQGEDLYQQYCAACHGANLEGQGDWRSPGPDGRLPAPPHDETGHTWHHGDQLLFAYTKYGGAALMAQRGMDFDSGMPGFEDTVFPAGEASRAPNVIQIFHSKTSFDSRTVYNIRFAVR